MLWGLPGSKHVSWGHPLSEGPFPPHARRRLGVLVTVGAVGESSCCLSTERLPGRRLVDLFSARSPPRPPEKSKRTCPGSPAAARTCRGPFSSVYWMVSVTSPRAPSRTEVCGQSFGVGGGREGKPTVTAWARCWEQRFRVGSGDTGPWPCAHHGGRKPEAACPPSGGPRVRAGLGRRAAHASQKESKWASPDSVPVGAPHGSLCFPPPEARVWSERTSDKVKFCLTGEFYLRTCPAATALTALAIILSFNTNEADWAQNVHEGRR